MRMRARLRRLALLGAALSAAASAMAMAGEPGAPPGVANVQLAWQNWTLNCQGCHRLDGTGSDTTAPGLAGTVAKFLWVTGGVRSGAGAPGRKFTTPGGIPASSNAFEQLVPDHGGIAGRLLNHGVTGHHGCQGHSGEDSEREVPGRNATPTPRGR